jgi:glycosyltransferase 2 family protein
MKRYFQFRYLFWLAVPLLLGWALRHVSLTEVGTVLRQLTPAQILALVAINLLVLFLFSARWWLISRAQGYPIPYLTLAGYRLASFGVSYFTPGPQVGGEPLQVYLLERIHRVPRATAISGVSLDKSLELLANFTFLALGAVAVLQWQIFPKAAGAQTVVIVMALLLLVVGLLLAVLAGKRPVSALWKISIRLLPPPKQGVAPTYHSVYQTISDSEDQATQFCRRHPLTLSLALGVSMIVWGGIIGEFWLATYLLGLNLTPIQVISLLTAARIAFLLPMPGALGTLEAGQVFALTAMGLSPAAGLSLTVLIRLRDVAMGVAGLWWGGVLLQAIQTRSKVY